MADQKPTDDIYSKGEPIAYMRMRGLPYSASPKDVIDWLGEGIAEHVTSVEFTTMRDGRPSGNAYVSLSNYEAHTLALKEKQNKMFGRRYIEIFESDCSEMARMIASTEKSLSEAVAEGTLKCRGLPYSATEPDIRQFFDPIPISTDDIVMPIGADGRPSGIAYLKVYETENVAKALAKNKEYMGGRYIEVSPCSEDEMNQARRMGGGGGAQHYEDHTGGGAYPTHHGGYGHAGGQPYGGGGAMRSTMPMRGARPMPYAQPMRQAYGHQPAVYGQAPAPYGHPPAAAYGHQQPEPTAGYDDYDQSQSYDWPWQGQGYGSQAYGAQGHDAKAQTFASQGGWQSNARDYSADYSAPEGKPVPVNRGPVPLSQVPVPSYPYGVPRRVPGVPMGGGSLSTRPGEGVMHMRGLPFKATKEDVMRFFSSLGTPKSVEIEVVDGRPSGSAKAIFHTVADAERCLALNKQNMGTRYIELSMRSR